MRLLAPTGSFVALLIDDVDAADEVDEAEKEDDDDVLELDDPSEFVDKADELTVRSCSW